MDDILECIDGRKASLANRMPEVMRQIEQAFAPLKPIVTARLQQVMEQNGSRRSKVIRIQELVSDVRAVSTQHAACKEGCSTCCTQRVMMSQTEADAIGHKIGRPVAQLRPDYVLPEIHDYGKGTPCTFLVDHACSIYHHRPVMCRNQVNLDVDSLLCGFENWELYKVKDARFTPIPLLLLGPLIGAYQEVAGQDRLGDIRAFFPAK